MTSDRRGASLLELLVASAIGLTILTAVYRLLLQGQEVTKHQTEMIDLGRSLRGAMDRMTREVRQAGNDPTGLAFDASFPFLPPGDLGPNRIHVRMDLPHDCGGRAGDDDDAPCPSRATCGGAGCQNGEAWDVRDKNGSGRIEVGRTAGVRGENELGNGIPDDVSPDEDVTYEYCESPSSSPTCPESADHQIFRTVDVRGEAMLLEPFADGVDMAGQPVFTYAYRERATTPFAVEIVLRGRTRSPDPRSGEVGRLELRSTVFFRSGPRS